MSSLVSVVIPAYNAAQDLSKAIESVLQQKFDDFELLIVDDGSTDNTADIANHYAEKDQRIKLISQPNQGVSAARNTGICKATGKFIAFLDSDDLWLPDKLAAHVSHLKANPRLGLSFARVEFINEDGSLTGQRSNLRLKNVSSVHLYEENLACTPSNVVIRKEALDQVGGFDGSLSGCADIELFLRISCQGWEVEGLDEVLVFYRTSTNGMSAQLHKMEEEWYHFSNQVKAYAPDLVSQHYPQAKALLLRYLARRSLRLSLSPQTGMDFINRALSSDWKIIMRQPRRTVLTLLAVYFQYLSTALVA